jgi:Tol biopolymer transport system component
MLNVQSKEIGVIHPIPPQAVLQRVAWAPDGKRIFLTAYPGYPEKGRFLEMDLEGRNHVILENNNYDGWIGSPVPSPDGKCIAYTSAIYESNVTLLEHF